MSHLLDTCFLSELARKTPDDGVVEWLKDQDEHRLLISSLTIGELHRGVQKLDDGRRKKQLRAWLIDDITARFEGRILPVDVAVAARWGEITGDGDRRGKALPAMDALIASTALVHGLIVVTRNVEDFARCGAQVHDPWRSREHV